MTDSSTEQVGGRPAGRRGGSSLCVSIQGNQRNLSWSSSRDWGRVSRVHRLRLETNDSCRWGHESKPVWSVKLGTYASPLRVGVRRSCNVRPNGDPELRARKSNHLIDTENHSPHGGGNGRFDTLRRGVVHHVVATGSEIRVVSKSSSDVSPQRQRPNKAGEIRENLKDRKRWKSTVETLARTKMGVFLAIVCGMLLTCALVC